MNIKFTDPKGNTVFSIESTNNEIAEEYIFIRLYNTVYLKASVSSILKKGIKIINTNEVESSHASIGFSLKDEFYGLTYDFVNKDGTLKKESCTDLTNNDFMSRCDPNKSTYITYALPVSKSEYNKAKDLVEKSYKNPNVLYSTGTLFAFIFPSLIRKIRNKRIDGSLSPHDAKQYGTESMDLNLEEKKKLCCSTFVSAVLYTCVKSIKDFFDKNKLKTTLITPSDLSVIPGLYRLFSGTCRNYLKDRDKFISKHPEFNRYK